MSTDARHYTLVSPKAGMFDAWYALFATFAGSTGVPVDEHAARTLWRWLLDGSYRLAAVFALDGGKRLVGIAHYRPFPDVLTGTELCALDALAVADDHRGAGLEQRLIAAVCEVAGQRGWSEVRATVPAESVPTLGLEGVGMRTSHVTYRIPVTVARP